MMATRTYGLHCGLANALDLVGERWALLILRDLLVAPRRFTDLHTSLSGIPSNVLATRLRQMEEHGLAERFLPPGSRTAAYRATARAAALEPAILSLATWGAVGLDPAEDHDSLSPESLVMLFRATFNPNRAIEAGTLTGHIEVRGATVYARVHEGRLESGLGAVHPADLEFRLSSGLLDGITSPKAVPAAATRSWLKRGNQRAGARFLRSFGVPPVAGPALAP